MKFLCEHHREQILNEPTTASTYWSLWVEQGLLCFEQEEWDRAAQFLGCSYEAAEWLLDKPDPVLRKDGLNSIDRYMVSGHHLAEAYGRAGQHDLELNYLIQVHNQLIRLANQGTNQYWPLKHNLEISLIMLNRYSQLKGKFSGYECFVKQTDRYIRHLKNQLN